MKAQIPVMICVDIEPNERAIDPDVMADWTGFEESYEFFNVQRRRLEDATGSPVQFSWFLRMDPQVTHVYGSADWAVNHYRWLIEGLQAAGDELGLHSHAWRWDDKLQYWISDFGNPEWVEHCVRSAFAAFETSLNLKCRSFRFGDHWIDNRTIALLEELGATIDLTVEPGAPRTLVTGEPFTGVFPDYTRIPLAPYRPSKSDFSRPGILRKRRLWVVPISAGLHALPTKLPPGRANKSSPHSEYMSLLMANDPLMFAAIADKVLTDLKRPYLAIPARTDMAIAPKQRLNLEKNFQYLLSHARVKEFVFVTPSQAIEHFNSPGR